MGRATSGPPRWLPQNRWHEGQQARREKGGLAGVGGGSTASPGSRSALRYKVKEKGTVQLAPYPARLIHERHATAKS
jgi:hypothetical protein